MSAFIDMVGCTFGRLTVVRRAPNRGPKSAWECNCACGGSVVVTGSNLRTGHVQSCGCIQRERTSKAKLRHGDADRSPEYAAWKHMIQRCENPNVERFLHYGGRGIRVCERWRSSYATFLIDMGRRPSPKHSIDRIDVDGDYEPGNCRWATRTEQARNT